MLPALTALLVLGAAPQRWAVVDVDAPDALMALAGQVTRAVVAEAQAQKLPVLGPEELRALLKPKDLEALRRCGGKPACVAQLLEGQGVTRAVLGQLGRDEKNYLLKLWLIDVPGLQVVTDVDRPILIAARRFQADVAEAVPRLLRGEREARGTLIIESNLADAAVSVNGEPVGTPPVKLTLKPGKYEVKLERKKYLGVSRLLGVEADQTTRERIALLLKPGEVADEAALPSLARRPEGGGGGGGFHLGAGTWICGALTLVGVGGVLYFGLTEKAQAQRLLDGYQSATGTYAGTRQDALAAQQSALLTNVSWGVAGAALVATVVFLVLDATRPQAVTVAPWLGAFGGGFALGGRF
jgi:PEGA domain